MRRSLVTRCLLLVVLAGLIGGPGSNAVPVSCTTTSNAEVCVGEPGNPASATVTHQNELTGSTQLCFDSQLFVGLISTVGQSSCAGHGDRVTGVTTVCQQAAGLGGVIFYIVPLSAVFVQTNVCMEHNDAITGETLISCLAPTAVFFLVIGGAGLTCVEVSHADSVTGTTTADVDGFCGVVTIVPTTCAARLTNDAADASISHLLVQNTVEAGSQGHRVNIHTSYSGVGVCVEDEASKDCTEVP